MLGISGDGKPPFEDKAFTDLLKLLVHFLDVVAAAHKFLGLPVVSFLSSVSGQVSEAWEDPKDEDEICFCEWPCLMRKVRSLRRSWFTRGRGLSEALGVYRGPGR